MVHMFSHLCWRVFVTYLTDERFWVIKDFLRVNTLKMEMEFAFGTHFNSWFFSCCFAYFTLVKDDFLSFFVWWFGFSLIFLFGKFSLSLFSLSLFFLYEIVLVFLEIVLRFKMIFHTLRVSWFNNFDDFLLMVIWGGHVR